MYHGSVMQRPTASKEEDEHEQQRMRRERNGSGQYDARSPTQTKFPQPPFTQSPVHSRYSNSSYPPPLSLSSPTHVVVGGPPASPLAAPTHPTYSSEYQSTPREKPTSNYYDPTSDSSERRPSESAPWFNGHPPPPAREYYNNPAPDSSKYYNGAYNSPVNANFGPRSPISHSHPPSRMGSISQSPGMPKLHSPDMRHSNGIPTAVHHHPEASQISTKAPARAADPMSFSSILSNADPAPAPQPPYQAPPPLALPPPQKQSRKPPRPSLAQNTSDEQLSRVSSRRSSTNNISTPPASRVPAKRQANGLPKPRVLSAEQEKEVQAEMAALDAAASDLDASDTEYSHEKQLYKARSLKRKLEVELDELSKEKARRTKFVKTMSKKLGKHAAAGEARYKMAYGEEAIMMVQQKEVDAEKERKKDMQRKRRREKTAQNALEQKTAALTKAELAAKNGDETEAQKYFREAERADKKAAQTKLILARGDKGPEIREVSPLAPNFQGGTMSTFAAETEAVGGKRAAKGRGGARLRKSKEQKQAEKDNAVRAQAAIDAGAEEQLLPSASKELEDQRDELNLRPKPSSKDSRETNDPIEPFTTKGYIQIYDQIWRDMARKDVTKVHKLAVESNQTKASNLKKTAILASKEAKRWQLKTNKGTKDLQARAKRVMREMMTFWKRNEREERDTRRAAEKQEIESLKKQEADREASRQRRKLNFLLSQTELYSHFIGKKIKTDEVERSTDHPDEARPTAAISTNDSRTLNLPEVGTAPSKVTRVEDLDFDADDDSALTAAAMANAQIAIQEAKDKARAFNNVPGASDSAMDEEGELNFQNPSGMGDVDIEQPKMLQAQLKEYQLKGLNWLVNLYEQGINGILADEMGLGKTVQSISVMAYLAEKHDIWGPFLVVAPSSTLHNWEQEIRKFVPTLKVLPYWGTAGDRKVLRKFWDRKHVSYTEDAPFHVMVTSYQLVVSDVAYFQKMKWQYMILDEAQAIKSSGSARWKTLLGFHCRNRLLLTGTPIQNNMQELWALLHFIMPSLFDSHDEFSEWFSKDIESHATSNTKLNEDQLKRLHMILKPFMLRRVKKHVQKELGDKIELDLHCDLTYRQRAYYSMLRDKIKFVDLVGKALSGDENDGGTLMNLVMQFRKVCNHPDLFERAETKSPLSFSYFAETASFMREGPQIHVGYSTRNLIEYSLPRLVWRQGGRLDIPGSDNSKAGFKDKYLNQLMNIWSPENTKQHNKGNEAFSWLRFSDTSPQEVSKSSRQDVFARAVDLSQNSRSLGRLRVLVDEEDAKPFTPVEALFRIVDQNDRKPLAETTNEGYLRNLFNVAENAFKESGLNRMERCAGPVASAPPIEVHCSSRGAVIEKENVMFNVPMRRALYGPSLEEERAIMEFDIRPSSYPASKMLTAPTSEKQRYTNISVPSMRRFVTDSGKLARLDGLLRELKEGGHRVLLYFQMTKMIDLMEEYLTYRNYKYCRLDGSTKLEDRRDTVHDFQTRPEIFIFLLSTRAGGLGINLTSADTVIFYDSDWNPTIDSQAMDRAHRLGQTRQVTVYRLITDGTIETRIRGRALQKEEVQRVVISGGSGGGVDFNSRSKENRTKDIAMWLADDDQAAEIERKEAELAALEAKGELPKKGKGKAKKKVETNVNLEDFYHEGEGHFDDGSAKPSGAATPISTAGGGGEPTKGKKRKSTGAAGGGGKKAKTVKQRLMMADGDADMGM